MRSMRGVGALLTVALTVVPLGGQASVAIAQEADGSNTGCESRRRISGTGTATVECVATKNSSRPGALRSRVARVRQPLPDLVNVPSITSVPPVGPCRLRTTETVPRSELAAMPTDSNMSIWMRLTARYPRCPTGRPDTSPEDAAIEVLERVPLPAPKPFIAPGFAITGKPGYLEPNLPVPVVDGRPTVIDSRATDLGEMAITASAVYRVQWGDAETGPHRGRGGPWPGGDITHVWTVSGTYDVVVTAEWTVRWRLGAAEGTLTVPTEGTIDDFRVDQLQAVRNR